MGQGGLEPEIPIHLQLDGPSCHSVARDMLRMQEVIFSTQPDVIIETGVAHGGSLIFLFQPVQGHGAGARHWHRH